MPKGRGRARRRGRFGEAEEWGTKLHDCGYRLSLASPIVLVLVVVLGLWSENDDEHESSNSGSNLKLLRDQLRDALLKRVGHLSNGFYVDQFDERINT